ncbi:uncharacterized protein [Branchiostoma lanceolatum]|uniref:uncharacterized protein isoform X2 n=1 Tax=Branchiostoma lanceolatum TaxID=7740 RepID=UPI003454C4D6
MHQGALVPEEPNFSESSQIQHGGGKGKGPELHAENRQKETTPPKFPPRDDLWRIWNIPNITAGQSCKKFSCHGPSQTTPTTKSSPHTWFTPIGTLVTRQHVNFPRYGCH